MVIEHVVGIGTTTLGTVNLTISTRQALFREGSLSTVYLPVPTDGPLER